MSGVHASERLSFIQNRNPEIRPSGIVGRLRWRVEMGTHLATERARMVTLHLAVGAPELYPDPLQRHRSKLSTLEGMQREYLLRAIRESN
jgi:hypothetical protein